MSLYIVEREREWDALLEWRKSLWPPRFERYSLAPRTTPVLRDCNEHDGEWPAFVTMPHETVEHEGMAVPAFEGDVERKAWEARRLQRRR